jgi:hypothetical protein
MEGKVLVEIKKGAIVRFVGQCPSCAGLEGEVVWADADRVEVAVPGESGWSTGGTFGFWAGEVKVLPRGYSKSFLKSADRRALAQPRGGRFG